MATVLSESPPSESSSHHSPSNTERDTPFSPLHRHDYHSLLPHMPTPSVSTQLRLGMTQFQHPTHGNFPVYPGYSTTYIHHSGLDINLKNNLNIPDSSRRTLWMGDLDPFLSHDAIVALWYKVLGKKVKVKIIVPRALPSRLKTNIASVYCFVEFELFEDANQALKLSGLLLPDEALPSLANQTSSRYHHKYFRLNWATSATLNAPTDDTPDYLLFVGDLAPSTTEAHLMVFFKNKFPDSLKTVRVMTDPGTRRSRCFGFVRFTDELSRNQALDELQGSWLEGRQIRLALATRRKTVSFLNDGVFSYKGYPPLNGYYFGDTHLGYHSLFGQPKFHYPTYLSHYNGNVYSSVPRFNVNIDLNSSRESYFDLERSKDIDLNLESSEEYKIALEMPKDANIPLKMSYERRTTNNFGFPTTAESQKVEDDKYGLFLPRVIAKNGPNNNNALHASDKDPNGSLVEVRSINQYYEAHFPPPVEGYYKESGPVTTGDVISIEGSSPNITPEINIHQQPHSGTFFHATNPYSYSHYRKRNTTVFIGGLLKEVTPEMLLEAFKEYGTIVEVKVPPKKKCGFVKYSDIYEAENAINQMQGQLVGGNRVRLGWGRADRRME